MKDNKTLFLAAAPVVLTIFVSAILQVVVLSDTERIANFLLSFGSWFLIAYILIQFTTIVIAPIGGAFIWLPMMAILGPAKGMLLAYLVVTPAYFVNFYLAKRFGRKVVKRLIGEKALEKIDHISEDAGTTTFVILKVLQGGYFDYVSYAAGLTKMSWRTFTLINVLGGIPSAYITYFTLSRFDNFLAGVLLFYAVTGVSVGLSIYINHKLLLHRKKEKSK